MSTRREGDRQEHDSSARFEIGLGVIEM